MARYLFVLVFMAMVAQIAPLAAQERQQPPSDLTVVWTTGMYAVASWTQTSNANEVCLSKAQDGRGVLLGCWKSAPGPQQVTMPNPKGSTDAAFFPHIGERYIVEEWRWDADGAWAIGRSNVALLDYRRRYLPLIERP